MAEVGEQQHTALRGKNEARICRFGNLRRAEIRSGHPHPFAPVHHRTKQCPHQKRPLISSKRVKRTLEASQKLSSLCAPFVVLYPSSLVAAASVFLRALAHALSLTVALVFQNDVEEYLSGSNAAIEKVLGAFQDALACVSCPRPLCSRLTFLACCALFFHLLNSFLPLPFLYQTLLVRSLIHDAFVPVGSTAIWTAT